jgi:nitrogen-specific signal transduction histidine kinase
MRILRWVGAIIVAHDSMDQISAIVASCVPKDVNFSVLYEGKMSKVFIDKDELVVALRDSIRAAVKKYFVSGDIDVLYDKHASPLRHVKLECERSRLVSGSSIEKLTYGEFSPSGTTGTFCL